MTSWSAPAPLRTTSRLIGAASCQGSSPASTAGAPAANLVPGDMPARATSRPFPRWGPALFLAAVRTGSAAGRANPTPTAMGTTTAMAARPAMSRPTSSPRREQPLVARPRHRTTEGLMAPADGCPGAKHGTSLAPSGLRAFPAMGTIISVLPYASMNSTSFLQLLRTLSKGRDRGQPLMSPQGRARNLSRMTAGGALSQRSRSGAGPGLDRPQASARSGSAGRRRARRLPARYRRRRLLVLVVLGLVPIGALWRPSTGISHLARLAHTAPALSPHPSAAAEALRRDLALARALSPLRGRIVAIAESQIGYRTDPPGTYCNKYSAYWVSGRERMRERQPGRTVVRGLRRLGLANRRRSCHLPVHQRRPELLIGELLRVGDRPGHMAHGRNRLCPNARGRRRLRARRNRSGGPARGHSRRFCQGRKGPDTINGDGDHTGFSAVEIGNDQYQADVPGQVPAPISGYVSPG